MKIIAFSDIHANFSKSIKKEIDSIIENNDIEVIICAGDFSSNNINFYSFLEYFNSFNVKNKIIVAGNHDIDLTNQNSSMNKHIMKEMNIIYLEDSEVIIDGIKFYGTPWTPTFMNWAFMKDDLELSNIFDNIPEDTDVLISHGPPYGILDETKIIEKKRKSIYNNFDYKIKETIKSVGSISLLEEVNKRKNIKYHIFGHVHTGYGYKNIENKNFYNVSLLNDFYKFQNPPTLIEIKKD